MRALWFLATLTGCGDKDDDTATAELGCFASAPTIQIGGGDTTYEELSAGDAVTMVHGPQGGWHMLASVWAENFDQIVEIDYTITVLETGAVISDNSYRVALVTQGECGGYFPGMYGYLSVTDIAEGELDTPPELLAYETVVLAMTVADSEGRTASAELEVIAEPDPIDVAAVDTGKPQ
jgi:hypothetical protein